MKQTITVNLRASENGLQAKLKEYFDQGWKLVAKQRGSWWGKIGNTYNWNVRLEREDGTKQNTSTADELMKYKKLLDEGAITESEYQSIKEKILKL
ncbi:MAG: SHOCT domain-containing protein [Bacilli bacterium]|nr:SHOCT domain-containing protein [Bacilli bacterium]MBO6286338.1 SHOCT domain-containing protein [Bacilli bacterium]